ncbi:hypothetical protein V1509DRAFT_613758 [Lipomyces kononenkoae]
MSSDEISIVLQNEFPDLDSALVAAISLDANSLEEARTQCSHLYFETIVDRDYEDQWSQSSTQQDSVSLSGSAVSSSSDGSWDTDGENQLAFLALERKPLHSKVSFLSMCFPTRKQQELQDILAGCDNNIAVAIDELLSSQFINEQGFGAEVDSVTPDQIHTSRGKKRRNRRNVKNIWDSGPSSWNANRPRVNHIERSELIRLSGLLGIPVETAQDIEQRHSGSPIALYLQLLEANPGAVWSTGATSTRENLAELSAMFPGLPSLFCSKILRATNNDLNKSTDIAIMILLKSQECGEDLTSFMTHTSDVKVVQSPPPITNEFETVTKKKEMTIGPKQQLSAVDLHQVLEQKSIAHRELLTKANELDRRRNNKNFHHSASAHYRVAATELRNDVKHHRLEYARALVDEGGGQYSIDLHGIGVHEANVISGEKLQEWWAATAARKPRPEFKIITGVGNHSVKGKARILPFLIKSLGGEGWMFYVGHGCIVVYGLRGQR